MLSWFRKKRTNEDGKPKAIEQLATLLREHGSTILGGKGKLCLTTQVLISLNRHFQQLALAKGIGNSQFQVLASEGQDKDITFIFDFVQKTPNLKLVSGPICVPSPQLCLLGFKSLEVLEIQRVPIIYVRGLHNIAKHIKTLICHRSTSSIKDVVYQFGRDFNGVLTLLELEVLDLSYNTITSLDQSLKGPIYQALYIIWERCVRSIYLGVQPILNAFLHSIDPFEEGTSTLENQNCACH